MSASSQRDQFHLTARPTRRRKMRKPNVLWIMCLTLFLASTVRAQTGVNNAEMMGDYAFTFNGMTTGGNGASTVFAAGGRVTAGECVKEANGVLVNNGG